MGKSFSMFTDLELENYEALTYLTREEIHGVHRLFIELNPVAVLHDKNAKLPFHMVKELAALKFNPFKDRMVWMFSSPGDGLTFENVLDMMSVFSDSAPKSIKILMKVFK